MTPLQNYIKSLGCKPRSHVYIPAKLIGDDFLSQTLKDNNLLDETPSHCSEFTCPRCNEEEKVRIAIDSNGRKAYFILCEQDGIWEKIFLNAEDVERYQFDHGRYLDLLKSGALSDRSKDIPSVRQSSQHKSPIPNDTAFSKHIRRFEYTSNMRDIRLVDPDKRWEKCLPYYGLLKPTAAHDMIARLLKAYDSNTNEGWCESDGAHDAFSKKYPTILRFKNEQIEVGRRGNGHNGEWRIIPDDAFPAHYRERIVRQANGPSVEISTDGQE